MASNQKASPSQNVVKKEKSKTKNAASPVPPTDIPIAPEVPRGLELLLTTDQLKIEQQVDYGEWFYGELNNGYSILDKFGKRLYVAGENSTNCNLSRGSERGWKINVMDYTGAVVMDGQRDNRCCACVADSTVHASGQLLGVIHQSGRARLPLMINDGSGAPVFMVTGNSVFNSGKSTFPIKLVGPQGTPGMQIGQIVKEFGGFAKELFTKADNFSVYYPVDLDVRMKGVLIFATIVLDFMFYEGD